MLARALSTRRPTRSKVMTEGDSDIPEPSWLDAIKVYRYPAMGYLPSVWGGFLSSCQGILGNGFETLGRSSLSASESDLGQWPCPKLRFLRDAITEKLKWRGRVHAHILSLSASHATPCFGPAVVPCWRCCKGRIGVDIQLCPPVPPPDRQPAIPVSNPPVLSDTHTSIVLDF